MVSMEEVAAAAIRAAEAQGRDVGSLSLTEIAAAGGLSRSTLVRRLGGRSAVDKALREQLHAPVTVADRITAAAAELIAADGLGALTLERVAGQAGCTVMSIYNQFGGRDGLLVAVLAEHAVLPWFAPLLDSDQSVEEMAAGVYRRLLDVGLDGSAVATALMLEAIGSPDAVLAEHVRRDYLPQANAALNEFFTALIERGAIRDQRLDTLRALFLGPVQFYVEVATVERKPRTPDDRAAVAAALAAGFARAVATQADAA
ncbi:TetR/AcrR family transcriptional regulator [Kribbella sp. DT2]|uniref:TetR/AcrR family transcriptional regulator n=1 Tax=Kribbella sp. DT2 TaxID=3393427 RepID=UPI003CEB96A4